jgi:hypothetical protein
MATSRLPAFEAEISRARDLVGLGQSITGVTHGRVDNTDLYRSALVHGVAALDAYVHGVVLDRAVDILMGRLSVSPVRTKIGLTFHTVQEVLTAESPGQSELAARSHIAQRLAFETFQKPDAIADALAMVGIRGIWGAAFQGNAGSEKTGLAVVVDRRNRIVHSCDIDPVTGALTPLPDADSLDAINRISRVVNIFDRQM